MVTLAVAGRIHEAGELFEHCIMCSLCVAACPESIDPAHLGMLTRRLSASLFLRPDDLMSRLREIEQGQQSIVFTPVHEPERAGACASNREDEQS